MKARHLWKLDRQVPSIGAGSPEGAPGITAVWLTERDRAQVQTLRRRWALEAGRPVVVMCPGARSHLKRWTVEGFAHVADRLIAERRAQIVFSGEPEEEAIIEEIRGLMRGKAITAVGLMTLPQVGWLMREAALVVTNDSASLHLASAAGAPTLALFGPTDESKYGPTAARHRVIRRQLVCAPCERAVCRFNHECMRFITPEEVFNAASDLLQQATSNKQQRRVEPA
jgi:lipopolysaccharide heptosyltransferase II